MRSAISVSLLVSLLSASATLAAPEIDPLVSGTSSLVSGVHVHTDYVYDEGSPNNEADLVQLQLSRNPSGDWQVVAVLQTLLDPTTPLLGVGFDTDANPLTGGAAPPGGSWSPQGPLGLEVVLALSDQGAEVLQFVGASYVSVANLPATVDAAENSMAATIPAALIPVAGPALNAVGWLGVITGNGSWLDGGEDIHDLAYVGGEAPSGSQNAVQSAVLAGNAASTEAVAQIVLADLDGGVTQLFDFRAPGWHTFLYHSALDLGEGIGTVILLGPNDTPIPVGDLFAGPYQPYLVRVPDPLPALPPLMISMHGLNGSHTSNVGSFGPGRFDPAAVVVLPLGRGGTTFFINEAEQDVIDVFRDAQARFGTDPDRTILSGISMGGFGTFRIGVRYPHFWSALLPLIGTGGSSQNTFPFVPPELLGILTPADGFPGGSSELLENLRNTPMRMINGQLDPIVSPELPERDAVDLYLLGYDFRAWMLHQRHHEVVPELSNCVLDEVLAFRRQVNPARVTYSVEPALEAQRPTGLDLRYREAYWVSAIEVAPEVDDAAEEGTVDVISLARADRTPVETTILDLGENQTTGADLCGPNPAVQTDDSWRVRGLALSEGPPEPVSNALEMTLTLITGLRVDLPRAGVVTGLPLSVQVHGDGPVELRLAAAWPGAVDVLRDGQFFAQLSPVDGEIVISDDMNGDPVYTLTALDLDGDGALNASDNCPTTANPDQLDRGGINTRNPDGIGDACQCGDVSGNGVVNGQDANAIRRHGLEIQPNPLFRVPGHCDVSGNGTCNGQDGLAVRREALGYSPNPLFGQRCPSVDPLLPCAECD